MGQAYGVIRIGDSPTLTMPPINRLMEHVPEMLLGAMDWAAIDMTMLLQGPFYGELNDYVAEAVKRYPAVF